HRHPVRPDYPDVRAGASWTERVRRRGAGSARGPTRAKGAAVRRLTLNEVNERHGGTLPPDAVFRPDDTEGPPPPAATPKRRTRSARFAVLNAFTDFGLADLTGAEAKVWLILFRDAKAATGTARTGQTDIARRA